LWKPFLKREFFPQLRLAANGEGHAQIPSLQELCGILRLKWDSGMEFTSFRTNRIYANPMDIIKKGEAILSRILQLTDSWPGGREDSSNTEKQTLQKF